MRAFRLDMLRVAEKFAFTLYSLEKIQNEKDFWLSVASIPVINIFKNSDTSALLPLSYVS